MKNIINYISIIILSFGITSCSQWELPELKRLYNCSTPTEITSQANISNFRNYTFNIIIPNVKDVTVIDWTLTKSSAGTTSAINQQQLQAASAYTATNLADGNYTVTAKITTVCQSTVTLTSIFSVKTPQLTVDRNFALTDPMVHSNNLAVAVANDGTVIANENNDIKIWNYTSKTLLRTLKGHTNTVNSLVLSTDEKYLFSSAYDNIIIVWDWKTGAEVRRLSGHTQNVYALNISADNKYLVSSSADKTIKIWNVTDGTLVKTISTNDIYYDVAISNEAKYIIGGYSTNTSKVTIWNGQTGAEYWTFTNGNVLAVSVNPAGSQIWVGGNNNKWYWESFDLATKQLIKSYTNASYGFSFKMSTDGRYITNGGTTIDTQTQNILYTTYNNYSYSPENSNMSVNNAYIVSSSYSNGNIALATLTTGIKINNNPTKHLGIIKDAAVSKDLKTMITADKTGTAKEWELATGNEKRSVTLSDKSYVYTNAYTNNAVWLRNCQAIEKQDLNGNLLIKVPITTGGCSIQPIAVSNDEQILAVETYNSSNSSINIYNANNGTAIKTIALNANTLLKSLAFSSDNKYIIAIGSNGNTYIINFASGAILRIINSSYNFTLSEDGKFIATVDGQKIVVSNLETGATTASSNHSFRSYGSNSINLAFSPDGRYITAGSYTEIKVLDITSGTIAKTIALTTNSVKLFYNATGTQLYVITEKDFQVFNL